MNTRQALSTYIAEALGTFALVFAGTGAIVVNDVSAAKGLMAGAAIGATVCLEALFAGPMTGASMNPARSLAPALVSGQLDQLWIYLFAPFFGAALASFSCRLLRGPECCRGEGSDESS